MQNVELSTANVRLTPARRKHPTHDAIVEKADEERAGQAGEDQEGIVLVLPDRHGVVRDARGIFWVDVLI